MSEVKLPYFPKQVATLNVSPFGVPELSCHKIYEQPLPNKVVFRVDVLESIRDIFGDECLYYRDYLYNIVAGNTANFGQSIRNLYKKFPTFRTFVNDEFYFGDTSRPIADRIKDMVQDRLTFSADNSKQYCMMSGGKFLVYTHYYLYFAFANKDVTPKIDGGIIVC